MTESMWHVTSSLNRTSIETHGLDVTRMDAAPGIAGSHRPENDGVHLCRDPSETDFFVAMNNTGGPVDVWEVDDVDPALLVDNGSGFDYLPGVISRGRIRLHRRDLERPEWVHDDATGRSTAYGSSLTITLEDGTVLRDEQAHERMQRRRG